MNIFTIPSWYPTDDQPIAGIFIREQINMYAKAFPEDKIGVSLWGSHQNDLLLDVKGGLKNIPKLLKTTEPSIKKKSNNLIEFFHPAYTWSRRFRNGNIKGIIEANENNFEKFEKLFGKPNLIHAQVAYPGGHIARFLAKKFGIPYIITEQMSPFPLKGLEYGFQKYVLESLKQADCVIGVSKELKDRLNAFNIDCQVLPNFIDGKYFQIDSSEKNQSNAIEFLTVGRLAEQKGHRTLIEACNILKEKLNFNLTIIGDGSLRKKLESKTQTFGLADTIRFEGALTPNRIVQELHRCDAFVFPSLHESFGIAPLEALACGKPVIGTDVGAVGSMINGDTGKLVPIESSKELAHAMLELANDLNAFDAKKIRAFYERNFSEKVILAKLRSIYENTIALK
jgi:glycosyltransferase involved in cell wall biosynthesis